MIMKSIKPSREMSGISFIIAVVMVIFGIMWLGSAGGGFDLFGIVFILLGIFMVIWHFSNATGIKRFSLYDITDNNEAVHPAEKYPFDNDPAERPNSALHKAYCPWCGGALENKQYVFCPMCGKRI